MPTYYISMYLLEMYLLLPRSTVAVMVVTVPFRSEREFEVDPTAYEGAPQIPNSVPQCETWIPSRLCHPPVE